MVQSILIIFLAICLASNQIAVEAKPPPTLAIFPHPFASNGDYENFTSIATRNIVDTDDVDRHDAFISYRRSNSRNLAMLLKVLLERENVSAFIDVEDLEGGLWERQLITGIQQSPNFLLVLANGTLDRCRGDVNYTDFLHREIKEAVDGKRRIVLIFDDFDFPNAQEFSPEIQAALEFQGLTWEHRLVDQSVERLLSYMSLPGPLSHPNLLPSRQDKLDEIAA